MKRDWFLFEVLPCISILLQLIPFQFAHNSCCRQCARKSICIEWFFNDSASFQIYHFTITSSVESVDEKKTKPKPNTHHVVVQIEFCHELTPQLTENRGIFSKWSYDSNVSLCVMSLFPYVQIYCSFCSFKFVSEFEIVTSMCVVIVLFRFFFRTSRQDCQPNHFSSRRLSIQFVLQIFLYFQMALWKA